MADDDVAGPVRVGIVAVEGAVVIAAVVITVLYRLGVGIILIIRALVAGAFALLFIVFGAGAIMIVRMCTVRGDIIGQDR